MCAACRRIERGVHPDVLTIEPGDTGSIKIEPIRDVIDRAGFRPFEGRRRVVIIDEADALVAQAQNALLKTLEEPPSASVFLLVSSMPDALLPTVRSRCPRLRFAALPVADVATALMRDHEFRRRRGACCRRCRRRQRRAARWPRSSTDLVEARQTRGAAAAARSRGRRIRRGASTRRRC